MNKREYGSYCGFGYLSLKPGKCYIKYYKFANFSKTVDSKTGINRNAGGKIQSVLYKIYNLFRK